MTTRLPDTSTVSHTHVKRYWQIAVVLKITYLPIYVLSGSSIAVSRLLLAETFDSQYRRVGLDDCVSPPNASSIEFCGDD